MAMAFHVEIGFKFAGQRPTSRVELGQLGNPSSNSDILSLQKRQLNPAYCRIVWTHVGLCFWPEQRDENPFGNLQKVHRADSESFDCNSCEEVFGGFLEKSSIIVTNTASIV